MVILYSVRHQMLGNQILKPFLRFLGVWIITAFLLALKIPSSFQKIYAEDGSSLQQSLENPFPYELFEPVAGYLDVLLRSAGLLVSLFPLEFAPRIFFAVNTMLLAILWISVFISSRAFINRIQFRFLLASGLILMPIGNFESIANSANLHFYFMSACVAILLAKPHNNRETLLFCIVVFLSASSIPLLMFTLPLITLKYLLRRSVPVSCRDSAVVAAWVLGNVLQLVYILMTALGQRKSNGINSSAEVAFLYLDRVFGSTLIPFWGMVSTSTQSPFPELLGKSSYLALRAVIAMSLLLILVLFVIKICGFTADQRLILLTILGTGLIQWLIIGSVFNPEPRYAIFSSFCLLLALLYSLQYVQVKRTQIGYLAMAILALTWLGSWTPSTLRTEGPYWSTELNKARSVCASGEKFVVIPTTPINQNWEIKVNCKYILKDN
jgi:hypothetical protein